ncbi:MAG: hypothetical protein ABIR62_05235 [Dokdonella sp.]|uniref:hypothetical protein n=1 Tax=Dokdonella sp. TaxID=2291710 RepID=UPI003266ABF8
MVWIGWVIAIVAIPLAAWLLKERTTERSMYSELLCAKIKVDNDLDLLRAQHIVPGAVEPPPFAEFGAQLEDPLQSVRAHLDRAGLQLDDYRARVKHFDEAVQYCLQPVELIFGADKATLSELMRHVEGARRKLFESRSALEKNPMHNGAGALGVGLGDMEDLIGHVRTIAAQPAVDRHADIEPTEPTDDGYDDEFVPKGRPNHGNPMLT